MADHARFHDDGFFSPLGDHLAPYYKAIHLLAGKNPSKDDVSDLQFMLVASSALWNVDLLSGRPKLAMVHLRAGKGLLEHLRNRRHADPALLQEVHSQFQALSEVAYGDADCDFDPEDFDLSRFENDADFPLQPFSTLLEARNSLRRCLWAVFLAQNARAKSEKSILESAELVDIPLLLRSNPAYGAVCSNAVDRWHYRLSLSSAIIPENERDVLVMHVILARIALRYRNPAHSVYNQEKTEQMLRLVYRQLDVLFTHRHENLDYYVSTGSSATALLPLLTLISRLTSNKDLARKVALQMQVLESEGEASKSNIWLGFTLGPMQGRRRP
ncbi:hypothetical protein H2200_005487 [Cladophialophora chaetospira]|uniref:Transcription factor domain-containing protein n=1 Tax=Cladophialophora chaetospira TaxID=386627 RepID=A0AA39CJN7_9EURO|nr:hypothetical protein H2200_005487 [Cladophialophora chaetospira]